MRLLAVVVALAFFFVAWAQREARVAAEQEAHVLELRLETLGVVLVAGQVHQQLVHDAAEAPHLGGLVVLLLYNRDLGRSVPARSYVQRHIAFLVLSSFAVFEQLLANQNLLFRLRWKSFEGSDRSRVLSQLGRRHRIWVSGAALRQAPRQAEITDFDIAVGRQQNVCRLNVSMHDVGQMDKADGHQRSLKSKF